MRIIVDRARCTGIGVCESIAPEHFEVNDDGELVLLQAVLSEEDRATLEQAVRSCPALALKLAES